MTIKILELKVFHLIIFRRLSFNYSAECENLTSWFILLNCM